MSQNITKIYRRYLAGTLTRVELDLLLSYFKQASEDDLKKLIDEGLGYPSELPTVGDIDERLQRVQSKLIDHTFRRPVRSIWKQSWVAVAASVLLILGCYYFFSERSVDPAADILAPAPMLFVKNAMGEQLTVSDTQDSVWLGESTLLCRIDSQTFRVVPANGVAATAGRQTLYTERSDFKVILEDGSTVTLNAHSSLTLDIPFDERERRVTLMGEGFFDVVPDASRPFKVHARGTQIEVLGTQFNVRSFPEGEAVETVLIHGKVALTQEGRSERVLLAPGQKAISDGTGIHVEKSRTKQVIAWKDRYFMYEDESLANVLQDVAKWYGIGLDTVNMPLDSRIYMKINKNLPLSEVLQLLGETSNVEYTFEQGRISIQ